MISDATWVERATALSADFARAAAEVDRSGRFPAEHVDAIRASGLLGLAVPERLGGAGVGLPGCAEVLRTLARGDGGTALGLAMHLIVTGAAARRQAGWPGDSYERTARAAARGDVILNTVASEAAGGSPARGGIPATRLAPVRGGWALTGRKDWATWAPAVTHALVTARLDEEDGPRIAQVLVPLDLAGVTRTADDPGVGLRSAANGGLVFDSVQLAREALLYTRRTDQPDPRGATVPAWFRVCTTAVYVGIAEAARDAVAEYARNRRPNDRAEAIAAIPAVRLRLGRIDADTRAAVLLLDAAARLVDGADALGETEVAAVSPDVSTAKVLATGLAWSVCEQSLRLAGGAALQGGALPLERLGRDVRPGLIHPPMEDALHMELGGRLGQD